MPDFSAMLAQLQDLWPVLTGFISLLAMGALMWLKTQFVTWNAYDKRQEKIERRFTGHEERLNAQDGRIVSLEGNMGKIMGILDEMPRRDDIQEVRGDLKHVTAVLSGVKDLVERQEAQVSMLQNHLLRAGR